VTWWTSLSSPSAIILFTALAKGNKLQHLHITNNLITDEACDVIATTTVDTSLVKLRMMGNKISTEAAIQLSTSHQEEQHITSTRATL